MPTVNSYADGERVLVVLKGQSASLSTREAFDLVTRLLTEIDKARGYGEALRGEVSVSHKVPKYRRPKEPK